MYCAFFESAVLLRKNVPGQKGVKTMEPRFENVCVLTKKHIGDHLRIITRRRTWALYGALWLVLIFMSVTAFGRSQYTLGIYTACLLALSLFAFFVAPELQTRLRYRKWYYIGFRDSVGRTQFYEDKFVYSCEGEPRDIHGTYTRLWAAFRKDDLIVLALRGKGEALLAVDGFEKGDLQKLKAFLARKAPKAKLNF